MCRNIKPLFNFEPTATYDEILAASYQFVRKISGFTKPSKVNEAAFAAAVDDIAAIAAAALRMMKNCRRTAREDAMSRSPQDASIKPRHSVDAQAHCADDAPSICLCFVGISGILVTVQS